MACTEFGGVFEYFTKKRCFSTSVFEATVYSTPLCRHHHHHHHVPEVLGVFPVP